MSKTEFLFLTPRRKRLEQSTQNLISMKDSLTKVTHTKFLGLIIDNELKFNMHVEQIIRKLRK